MIRSRRSAAHLVALALEKQLGEAHVAAVILLAHQAHAGAGAALDLILQAGPRTVAEETVLALTHPKGFLQKHQAIPHHVGVGIGAKIAALPAFDAAMEGEARIGLPLRQEHIGVGLVVPH